MTFTHQQQILYKEFLEEYIGEHTLDNFIEWCKYEMGPANLTEVTDSEAKTATPVNASNPRPASVTRVADPNTPTRPVGPTEEYPHTVGRRVACLTGQQWYDRFVERLPKARAWNEDTADSVEAMTSRAFNSGIAQAKNAACLAACLVEEHNG